MLGLLLRPVLSRTTDSALPLLSNNSFISLAQCRTASSTASSSSVDSTDASSLSVALPDSPPTWPVQPPSQSKTAKYRPWDFTRTLTQKPKMSRRMRFLMQSLDQEKVQKAQEARKFPDFTSGDILEVRMLVPEASRKEYVYKGVCIARYNRGIATSFKLYNVFPDAGGFVQHIPLYMPDMLEIKVVGRVHVAPRSKLYYLTKDETSAQSYQTRIKAQ